MSLLKTMQPILIIEDCDDDYETIERAFQGISNLANPIIRCEDGDEAIDYLFRKGVHAGEVAATLPGVILLDLNLPGKDGKTILKLIKNTPRLSVIPVIILTTSVDERDIQDCYATGANTFIRKPVDFEGFMEAIKQLNDYWFGIALLPKGIATS